MLFIPTYNCEKQIIRVLQQLSPFHISFFKEIIIFDNRSTDMTRDVAGDYITRNGLPIKIVLNDQNVNLGGTHKIAFRYAIKNGFTYCVVLHGDDQAKLGDFDNIFKEGLYLNSDFILGSRFSVGSVRINYSIVRTLGNIFFNILASLRYKTCISDFSGSGLNIFSLDAIRKIGVERINTYADDLTFPPFLLTDALKNKLRINFHPITWKEFDQSSNVRMIKQTITLFKILCK